MTNVFNRYATPLITGLFLVSLISGIALFLHIGPAGFHGMHEWLSMVLILPFALHVWKNGRPMLAHFRRAPMVAALVLSTVAALAFLVPPSGGQGAAGGPPQFQLAYRVMSQSLHDVAPALGATPQAVAARLTAAGFTVADGQTLTEIAAASGKSEGDLAAALLGAGS